MIEGYDDVTVTGGTAALAAMAEAHLPPDIRDRWLRLARPAVQLVEAADITQIPNVAGTADTAGTGGVADTTRVTGPAGRVVGQLGGNPHLPADTAWPIWDGHGPLTFIASLDCAALPAAGLDIPLPDDGTLLFFYFDGQLDEDALVVAEDPDSQPGARVLYVPADTATTERPTPAKLEPYIRVALTARLEFTMAYPWHPVLHAAFAPPGAKVCARYDHPVCNDRMFEALSEWRASSRHLVGGYPDAIQNPVELEIAHAALGGTIDWQDPRLSDEARRWVLLAQIRGNGAGDMEWGDCGALYWMIRREDLAARRLDAARFTFQCH